MGCESSKEKTKSKGGTNLKIKQKDTKAEIKVVFLGDAGVGKSSIAQRYCYNKFTENYDVTIGGVYHRKDVQLKNNQTLTLHLWDTGGEERFRAMAPLYYRDANAAILVYDVQDSKSFTSLAYWLGELSEKIQQEGIVIGVAGNKCDVDPAKRKIQKEQGQNFARDNNLIFFETSALTEEGIFQLFQSLSEEYSKRKLQNG